MIAIPVREGEPEALRFVLRSIHTYLEDTPVLIGHKPDWFTGFHIPTRQTGTKHQNIGVNLKAAIVAFTEFVWWSDDTFILQPTTPGVWARPHTVDHMVKTYPHIEWGRNLRTQQQLLQQWGFDTSTLPCSDSHHPMLIDSDRCMYILDRAHTANPSFEAGSFKALYGAGLEVTIGSDPKIVQGNRPIPDTEYVSVSPHSFRGQLGEELRESFKEKSLWER